MRMGRDTQRWRRGRPSPVPSLVARRVTSHDGARQGQAPDDGKEGGTPPLLPQSVWWGLGTALRYASAQRQRHR
jgi:hypothetical protein